MRLLLYSNGADLLSGTSAAASGWLRDHLRGARRLALVPFAGVTVSWDDYARNVRRAFGPLDVDVVSVHEAPDPVGAVRDAEAVVIGGGNTFHLIRALYETGLVGPIRERVAAGAPYVGWSAGANVACPSVRTTNDMPIVEPSTLAALGLVPFQINPHYTDAHPPGHRGETRADRLAEFVAANPGVSVVGLPEGTALSVDGPRLTLLGADAVPVFAGDAPRGALT
ncbi:MAG TPA: dipeptidase PepE, partial [Rubricoccaceae bacterium]